MNKKLFKSLYCNFKGFTLVELLVVITISVLLLGLLLIPIIKTLETNRMTAAYTSAQQSSRQAMLMIRKDASEAMYVADSVGTPALLPVNGLVDADGNPVDKPIVLQYGVINLIMPKTEFYCSNPSHNPNYPRVFPRGENYKTSGLELAINKCPSCNTDEFVSVVPKIPVEKSTTVVRYFLGLRDNSDTMTVADANDLNSWVTKAGRGWLPNSDFNTVDGDENPLILYRVEFDPVSDDDLFPPEYSLDGLSSTSAEYQRRLHRRITDPNVFYHPDCYAAWASRVNTVGMVEGMDLAVALKDDYKDGNPMRVKSIVAFTPAAISNEIPVANSNSSYGSDSQGFPNTTFTTKYGLLGNALEVNCVRIDPRTQKPTDKWLLKQITDSNGAYADIYKIGDPADINPDLSSATPIFNVNDYFYNNDTVGNLDQDMAFVYNKDKGIIDFSLNPVSWHGLDENIDQDKLLYYPELDVYSYKFMPYKYATVVPGSEDIEYYNAYWVNGSGNSFIDLGYNYTGLANNVSRVRYQRAPFSLGQLNYNQYKIDYEEGIIYWKPVLNHDVNNNIYPVKYADIPVFNSYKIQFNKSSDKLTVSYVTNEVIDVNLNIRMIYDSSMPGKSGIITERVIVGNSLK